MKVYSLYIGLLCVALSTQSPPALPFNPITRIAHVTRDRIRDQGKTETGYELAVLPYRSEYGSICPRTRSSLGDRSRPRCFAEISLWPRSVTCLHKSGRLGAVQFTIETSANAMAGLWPVTLLSFGAGVNRSRMTHKWRRPTIKMISLSTKQPIYIRISKS